MASRSTTGPRSGASSCAAAALERLPLIEPDDALNAIGRVERRPTALAVVVDDPGGIVLAGDPVAAATCTAREPAAVAGGRYRPAIRPPTAVTGTSRFAGLGGGPWPVDPGAAGLGTLLAISALSLAVTLLRRAQSRRRLAARIAARLATFAAPSGGGRSATPIGRLSVSQARIHSA